jgi:rhomboid protease GluP
VFKRYRGSTLSFLGYNLVFGMFVPGIDMAAHLGGLAVGFLCGVALGQPITPEVRPARTMRNLGVALGGLLVLGLAFVAVRQRVGQVPDLLGEFDQIAQVEERVLDVYNSAVRQSEQGKMDDAQLLRVLERDVLPPWREARKRLVALEAVPAASKSAYESFSRYMLLREQGWELLVESIRRNDDRLAQQARKKMKEADNLAESLTEQTQKKKP